MINISTDYSIENRQNYLCENNAYFKTITSNYEFTEEYWEIIKKIDGATIKNDKEINGKFGTTFLTNISAGTKTLLNILHMIHFNEKCAIDISSCGDNAIDVLVDILNKYKEIDIRLLTCLKNYISVKPINALVDNEYMINRFSQIGDNKNV